MTAPGINVRRGVLGNGAMLILAQVSGSAYILLGSMLFPQAAFGTVLSATAFLLIGGTVLNLGTAGSLPHFAAHAWIDGDASGAARLIASGLAIVAAISAGLVLVVMAVALARPAEWPLDDAYLVALAGMPFLAMAQTLVGGLQGVSRITQAAFVNLFVFRFLPLLALAAIWVLDGGVLALVASYSLTAVIMGGMGLAFLVGALPKGVRWRVGGIDGHHIRYSLNSWLTNVAIIVRSRGQAALFALFLVSGDVAAVAVAASLAAPITMIFLAVGPAFRQAANRFIKQDDYAGLARQHRRFFQLNLTVMLAATAAAFAFADDIVVSLLGEAYADTVTYWRILLLCSAVRIVLGPANPLLLALNRPDTVRRIDLGCTGVFLAAVALLVPVFGPIAAVWCVGGTAIAIQALKNWAVRRDLSLPWVPDRRALLLVPAAAGLSAATMVWVKPMISSPWAWVGLAPALSVAVLAIALGLGVFSLSDVRRHRRRET